MKVKILVMSNAKALFVVEYRVSPEACGGILSY